MRSKGFTLLELMVVLAIAATMMTLVPPMISSALPGAQLKATSRQLAAGLRLARNRALIQREPASLVLDLAKRRYQVTGLGRSHTIPEGIEVNLLTADSELLGEQQGGIRFFPEGGSTGGRITLSNGKRAFAVDVDWLTGKVRIFEVEPDT